MLRFPIIRLTLFFALGIALQKTLRLDAGMLWLCCGAAVILLVFAHILARGKRWFEPAFGFAAGVGFVLLGAACFETHQEAKRPHHYIHRLSQDSTQIFTVAVREKLKPSQKYARFICRVESVGIDRAEGRIVLQLSRKSRPPIIGEKIRVVSLANRLKKKMNPVQFDYSEYLENKGIYAQLYADSFTSISIENDIWHYADRVRERILKHLKNGGFGTQELAVFAALMLGQQQEIDAEIIRDYQYSGAVHILSVSGLHVGFLMVMVQFVLKFLSNSGRWKFAKLIIIISVLWLFAIVAGLAPSVVRSATMFSFVAVGMQLNRNANIFNTLFASMLLILLAKPMFLFDVGFQLSYSALFFIVWLKPIADRTLQLKSRAAQYFADILSVSVAAQIGTLPMSLFYFHQFPLLFFVTNLVVIPALGAIMGLGFVTLCWACVANVPAYLAWAMSKCIWLLDETISKIADQRFFVLTDISFSMPMLLAAYAGIVAIGVWARKPTYPKIVASIASILVFQIVCFIENYASARQTEVAFFHNSKQTLIAFRTGKKALMYASDTSDQRMLEYLAKPYLTKHFADSRLCVLRNVHSLDGRRLLVIDSSSIYAKSVQPDVLLLRGSPKINMDRALRILKPRVVIADGTNYKSWLNKWKESCQKQKIPFHATAEKGSYILKGGP